MGRSPTCSSAQPQLRLSVIAVHALGDNCERVIKPFQQPYKTCHRFRTALVSRLRRGFVAGAVAAGQQARSEIPTFVSLVAMLIGVEPAHALLPSPVMTHGTRRRSILACRTASGTDQLVLGPPAGCPQRIPLWGRRRCRPDLSRGCQLPFGFRDSLASRWPESGTLILLAKSSICGNRTANKRPRAGVIRVIRVKSEPR
jgi:hypothetical protein